MTIRFAAAKHWHAPAVDRVVGYAPPPAPANDRDPALGRDALLRAALRHFARHGLSAAERARDHAESAFFEGDRESCQRWLAICRELDLRMAEAAQRRVSAKPR